jgi:hypothetical protein
MVKLGRVILTAVLAVSVTTPMLAAPAAGKASLRRARMSSFGEGSQITP